MHTAQPIHHSGWKSNLLHSALLAVPLNELPSTRNVTELCDLFLPMSYVTLRICAEKKRVFVLFVLCRMFLVRFLRLEMRQDQKLTQYYVGNGTLCRLLQKEELMKQITKYSFVYNKINSIFLNIN